MSAERKTHGRWIYGPHGVEGMLSSARQRIVKILYARPEEDRTVREILEAAGRSGIETERVPAELIYRKTGSRNHRGIAALCVDRGTLSLEELHGILGNRQGLVVALDGVEDPQNLGAVLRTCECAGVDGVLVPERRASPITAAVVHASAGASAFLNIVRAKNLAAAILGLKVKGYWAVGAEAGSAVRYTEFDYRRPLILILGGEDSGIRAHVRSLCDAVVSIPTSGKTGCLNVSVAAGVILYEVVRQRSLSGEDGLR
jgi:23S rRNA (guanosine2251-2'-O)-methyltransferase